MKKKNNNKNNNKKSQTVWYIKRINTEGSNSNIRVIINEYFTENILVSIYVFISVKEHKMQVHFGPYYVFKYSLNLS